jgi:copper chaperone
MSLIQEIKIDNLKCGGCATTIIKSLSAIEGVSGVVVDNNTDTVTYTGYTDIRYLVLEKLRSMGYPESGSVFGLQAGIATAKSYVSCAIGKFTKAL